MFHKGDLQSGIALAVQQSKAVLCFVHGQTIPNRNDFLNDKLQVTLRGVEIGKTS